MTQPTRATAPDRRPAWPAAGVALAFLLAAGVMLAESFTGSGTMESRVAHAMGPAFFPRIVLVLLLVLSLAAVVEAVRGRIGAGPVPRAAPTIGMILATGAYVWLVGAIGFLLASIAYLVACPIVLGYRRYGVVLPLALIYAVAVWYVFQRVLQIVLPSSPWFALF